MFQRRNRYPTLSRIKSCILGPIFVPVRWISLVLFNMFILPILHLFLFLNGKELKDGILKTLLFLVMQVGFKEESFAV